MKKTARFAFKKLRLILNATIFSKYRGVGMANACTKSQYVSTLCKPFLQSSAKFVQVEIDLALLSQLPGSHLSH